MPEHVLDTSVFIQDTGMRVDRRFDDPVTVPAVVEELESTAAADRYDLSTVDVYAPADDAVAAVRDAAGEKGEDLSDADVQVLALAREREAVAVTDDYGMQNVAETLDIAYEGFRQPEIDGEVDWERVCSSCGAAVDGERCGRCGGEAERVPTG
ncbi:MAG: DNA-binding protein [Candidatus Nanohaloarchaea archaeon]|nr:DNA-binding protein [Candidatus Nanohaloarchaea archaeon]